MSITIDLPAETLRRLEVRASTMGRDVKSVVEQIVEEGVQTLDEAAAPLRDAVKRTGMSEKEVEDFLDAVVREVRTETPLRSR